MNSQNKFADIVQGFARRHGIANFSLSESGTAGLRLPEGEELYLEHTVENGKLFVYVIVGDLPLAAEERLAYMQQLLTLNCLEQGTVCGTLAIDERTNSVLLQAGIAEADVSVERLEQVAQELLHHRPRLTAELKQQEGGETTRKKKVATAAQLAFWQTQRGAR